MNLTDHCDDYAKKLTGNWKVFPSFGWHDRPEDADGWCIIYTHNRDSDALDRSNAEVIAEALAPYPDDVRTEYHGHWACGWVDGWAIRVSTADGYTEAFRAYVELALQLEDYPSLDDERLSEMEWNEACEYWRVMSIRQRVETLQYVLGPKQRHWQVLRVADLMQARRDEFPRDDNGDIQEYLRGH